MKVHDPLPQRVPASDPRRRARHRRQGRKTGGRGTKGQRAGTVPVGFEGGCIAAAHACAQAARLQQPVPRVEYRAINLDTIEASGLTEVTPETLLAKGLVSKGSLVKVLGRGELSRAVTVKVHACSGSAESAITGAGGSFEALPLPFKVRPAFSGSAHTNR